jgi:tetratricopeptide (TPR) repeat protein
MPATTHLQIQGADTDATRVVELSGAAIRIGRGAVCEVRLPESSLADVQCLLRLRGASWQVQPIGPSALMSLGGEPLVELRPFPPGVTLRIGSYQLSLAADEGAAYHTPIDVTARVAPTIAAGPTREETGKSFPALGQGAAGFDHVLPAQPRLASVEPVPSNLPAAAGLPSRVEDAERVQHWEARVEQRERWLQSRKDEKKWEARWRAAGEGLKARSGSAGSRPEPSQPQARRVEVSRDPAQSSAPVSKRSALPRLAPVPIAPPALPTPPKPIDPPQSRRIVTLPAAIEPEPEVRPEPAPASTALVAPPAPPPSIPRQIAPAVEPPTVLEPKEPEPPANEPVESPTTEPEIGPVPESTSSPTVIDAAPPASEVFWHTESLRVEPPAEVVPEPRPITRPPLSHPAPRWPGTTPNETPPPTRPTSAWPGTKPNPMATPPRPEAHPAEFPSAAAILAAQGTRHVAAPAQPAARTLRAARRPLPTEAIEPGQWTLPALAQLPLAVVTAVVIVGMGLILGVAWTKDNVAAGLAARAAFRAEEGRPVPLDPTERPETRWWKTTAGHMALWAAAIERSPEGASRGEEVIEALDAAHRAAPLQAEIRLALAQAVPGLDPPPAAWSVGLSRDIAALTLTGRTLKQAHKNEAAIRAYRLAFEMAAEVSIPRLDPPTFDGEPRVRRYRLAHEGIVAAVVRDMIGAGDWSFAEWSKALPARAVVRLAAGRVLRERSSPDAERAFEMALEVKITPPPGSLDEAEHLAAEAEALALLERKAEATERYRRAIGVADDEPTRRRWRLSLAEILGGLGETAERDQLLEAAKGTDSSDDVTRRAIEAQRYAGLK